MIKISTIFALGIFIAVIPFTGLPNDAAFPVKNILYIVCGLTVTILSLIIRKELEEVVRHLHTETIKTETFSESAPKVESTTEQKEEIK
jgi:hypothetical protein